MHNLVNFYEIASFSLFFALSNLVFRVFFRKTSLTKDSLFWCDSFVRVALCWTLLMSLSGFQTDEANFRYGLTKFGYMIRAISSVFFITSMTRFTLGAAELTCSCHVPSDETRAPSFTICNNHLLSFNEIILCICLFP